MNKLLKTLKEKSSLIATVAFIVAASCMLVIGIGGIDGNFFEVIGGILYTIIMVGMLAAIPALKIVKKEELVKPVTLIVLGYFFVFTTLNYLSESALIDADYKALHVVVGIFVFLAGLALIAAFALYCVAIFAKKDGLKKVIGYLLIGLSAYLAVVFILQIVRCIVFDYGFGGYFNAIFVYLAVPAALIFSVFPLVIGEIGSPENAEEKKETDN